MTEVRGQKTEDRLLWRFAPGLSKREAPGHSGFWLLVSDIYLRDIHGPVPLAGQPPYWAIGGAIALLLAVLAAFFIYLKKRRRPKGVAPLAPWETALAELAAARELQHQALLYVERVGEILRRYIESRFAIRSTRQTTREFLAGLSQSGGDSPLAHYRQELQTCLEQADMAKFARLAPGPDHMAEMERAVTDFVRKTEPPPANPPRKGSRP